MEVASLWILVRFISAEPRWEHQQIQFKFIFFFSFGGRGFFLLKLKKNHLVRSFFKTFSHFLPVPSSQPLLPGAASGRTSHLPYLCTQSKPTSLKATPAFSCSGCLLIPPVNQSCCCSCSLTMYSRGSMYSRALQGRKGRRHE